MNHWVGIGRLATDPEVRYAQNENSTAIARFNIAVDRKVKADNQQTADFISCVAFGKTAEFIEKYFSKGHKIALEGRIQTGSYTNKDGAKVYTTDVVIEGAEFVESKKNETPAQATDNNGFMNILDNISEELPFA